VKRDGKKTDGRTVGCANSAFLRRVGRVHGRLRAGYIARVGHAETARVRPWVAPHRPIAPGSRVAFRADRRWRGRASPAVRSPLHKARYRLRARPVVRVGRAETARVRPHRPSPPGCRVAGLHERVCIPPYNPNP
jgi:hypothetical protein